MDHPQFIVPVGVPEFFTTDIWKTENQPGCSVFALGRRRGAMVEAHCLWIVPVGLIVPQARVLIAGAAETHNAMQFMN